jgi:hypothetical protein
MPLSRDAILQANDLETREVHVPEWADPVTGDDLVIVRALSGKERDAYESSMVQQRGKEMIRNLANIRAKLVVKCVVDENGERLFADQDANALGQKSAAALDRVFEVAAELSRLTDEDIEELGKGSEETPAGDSSSG